MQFGVFSVSDITTNPTSGIRPTETEKLKDLVRIACHAEEAGLDVFALGEHHNPPFVASSPSTVLSFIGARTRRILLSTAVTLITTNDPVRIAEEFSTLQHLVDGRLDLVLGRGNTPEVYPWFGKDVQQGMSLTAENYALLRALWDHSTVNWEGEFRASLNDFVAVPRPLAGEAPFIWHGSIRSPQVAEQAAYYGDGFFHNHIFSTPDYAQEMVGLFRERFAHYGHGSPEEAIVGIGGQVFIAKDSQQARNQFRPYFDNAPAYSGRGSLEEYIDATPLAVGSPQEVIDKTLGVRDYLGDFQRQLFLIDHAGLPLSTVLHQIDQLADIIPVLRTEFDKLRAPGAPSDPPTHCAAAHRGQSSQRVLATNIKPVLFPEADDVVTGATFYPQLGREQGSAEMQALLRKYDYPAQDATAY